MRYVARMTDRMKLNLAKCKHMRTVRLGERKKKDVNYWRNSTKQVDAQRKTYQAREVLHRHWEESKREIKILQRQDHKQVQANKALTSDSREICPQCRTTKYQSCGAAVVRTDQILGPTGGKGQQVVNVHIWHSTSIFMISKPVKRLPLGYILFG